MCVNENAFLHLQLAVFPSVRLSVWTDLDHGRSTDRTNYSTYRHTPGVVFICSGSTEMNAAAKRFIDELMKVGRAPVDGRDVGGG